MTAVEINQDAEVDDDGDIGGWLDVFWCEGHDVDGETFLRALVDHCLAWGHDVPRIPRDAEPAEMWQHDRTAGDAVIFERERNVPDGARRADWRPVTVLDLERRFMGGAACSVRGCTGAVYSSQAFPVVWEPDGENLALDVRLCREHRTQIPDQPYRLRFIPVGATIVLEATP